MSARNNKARVAALSRRHGMDEALKAGIGATACSVAILAIILLAMHVLPAGIG